jgi:hypothetical protein
MSKEMRNNNNTRYHRLSQHAQVADTTTDCTLRIENTRGANPSIVFIENDASNKKEPCIIVNGIRTPIPNEASLNTSTRRIRPHHVYFDWKKTDEKLWEWGAKIGATVDNTTLFKYDAILSTIRNLFPLLIFRSDVIYDCSPFSVIDEDNTLFDGPNSDWSIDYSEWVLRIQIDDTNKLSMVNISSGLRRELPNCKISCTSDFQSAQIVRIRCCKHETGWLSWLLSKNKH